MRFGYSLGSLAGSGLTAAAHGDIARMAERAGFESLWSAEVAATDPAGFLGWLARQTTNMRLGTAVLQISGRSPVSMAATAATLSQLSGGRFVLGVGSSGPQVVEGWHGQPSGRPLTRMRDYITVLRMTLAGEPVQYAGQTLTLPLPGGQAQPLPFMTQGRGGQIPLYVAGLGPRMVALAGELADGWLAIHCPPAFISGARSWLAAGAAAAGRSLTGFDIAAMVLTLVEEDEELARDMMRPQLALYVGGMGTRQANFYNRLAGRLGFAEAASQVQDAYLAGRFDEAVEAIPDAMVDAMTLCGPADKVKERFDAYRAAGTGTLIVGLVVSGSKMRLEQVERIAELIG